MGIVPRPTTVDRGEITSNATDAKSPAVFYLYIVI